jgi:hypothetical protein
MRSLPLAPKPLTTLHCFDPSYRVPVYLDQPLWGEGRGRGLTTNMMSLCLQLDAAIVTSYLQDEVCCHSYQSSISLGRPAIWEEKEDQLLYASCGSVLSVLVLLVY